MSRVFQVETIVRVLDPQGDTVVFANIESDTDLSTAVANTQLVLEHYQYTNEEES